MEKLLAALFFGLIAFVVVFFFALVLAVVTQWAWAGSIAQIFYLPELTFSQAFWLNMLGGLVFKGSSVSKSK